MISSGMVDFWPWFLLLSLAISSLGFYRVVYFVSIGYAFSVTGIAVAAVVLSFGALSVTGVIHAAFLAVYGLRLGIYLVVRERRSSYAAEAEDVEERGSGVGPGRRILIWLGVSILYVAMTTPATFHLALGPVPAAVLPLAGLAIMGSGLLIEALADVQKSAFKKAHPKDFCNTGLYRFMRCPNYFGEILVWTGSLVAGMWALQPWWAWIPALFGYVCIFLIMMGSTKRLEFKQDERYGDREDYQRFVKTVPVLFPFVPIYSLKNVRVYLE
jgi:steroid 5-alpha reductase family enzyme